jgi:amidohydrolase
MMTSTPETLKAQAVAAVDAMRGELEALSERIHAHPELAFQEVQAAEWLAAELSRHGFVVETGIAGLPTAFRGTFKGQEGGPTIAILAEYDALPQIGHGCGHNIMGTAAVGAGIAASRVIGELKGTVVVLGTPAEEGGGGKVIMVKEGIFDGIDAAMIVHPATRTMVTRSSLASNRLGLEFFGKPAHAASTPEEGINALDACILTFVNINALRQHVKSDVRIHGIITNGGAAVNIVPEYASAVFSVRALDGDYSRQVLARVQTCAEAAAQATGATVKMAASTGYDNIRVNLALAAAFRANWESLGETVEEPRPNERMGSTDMGNVSYVVPAVHPYIAIAPETVAGHSHEFRQAAISPAGHRGLILAAKGMAMTAIDLLTDAQLLGRVKQEFAGL